MYNRKVTGSEIVTINNYDKLLDGIKYYESILKKLESENKKCKNIDVMLNSQIAGKVEEALNKYIDAIDLTEPEKEDILSQFGELKDYFADIQVDFELNCKCRKTTKEEQESIYKRHDEMVLKREGAGYVMNALKTVVLQLEEERIRKKGR